MPPRGRRADLDSRPAHRTGPSISVSQTQPRSFSPVLPRRAVSLSAPATS